MPLNINDYREMERQRREFGQCDPVTWSKVFASLDPATPDGDSFGNFYWGIGYESYGTAVNRFFTDAAVRAVQRDLNKQLAPPPARIEATVRPRTKEEERQGYSWSIDVKIWPTRMIRGTPPEDETA